MRFNVVQTIKDRLTMCEVLERYGYEPNNRGFICCPFHLEKTPSMKIFEKRLSLVSGVENTAML